MHVFDAFLLPKPSLHGFLNANHGEPKHNVPGDDVGIVQALPLHLRQIKSICIRGCQIGLGFTCLASEPLAMAAYYEGCKDTTALTHRMSLPFCGWLQSCGCAWERLLPLLKEPWLKE